MGGGRIGEMVFNDPPGSFGAMNVVDQMALERSLDGTRERRHRKEKLQEFAVLLAAEVTRQTIRDVVSDLVTDYGDALGADCDEVVEKGIALLKTKGIEITFADLDLRLRIAFELFLDDTEDDLWDYVDDSEEI